MHFIRAISSLPYNDFVKELCFFKIMYMYYILGWKLQETFNEVEKGRIENEGAKNGTTGDTSAKIIGQSIDKSTDDVATERNIQSRTVQKNKKW